eukprot:1168267-Rhodomonas_salina.1
MRARPNPSPYTATGHFSAENIMIFSHKQKGVGFCTEIEHHLNSYCGRNTDITEELGLAELVPGYLADTSGIGTALAHVRTIVPKPTQVVRHQLGVCRLEGWGSCGSCRRSEMPLRSLVCTGYSFMPAWRRLLWRALACTARTPFTEPYFSAPERQIGRSLYKAFTSDRPEPVQ